MQSRTVKTYRVGEIVFLPFVLTAFDEECNEWEARSSHDVLHTVEGGRVFIDIPVDILP
jgi:hypothetical protein